MTPIEEARHHVLPPNPSPRSRPLLLALLIAALAAAPRVGWAQLPWDRTALPEKGSAGPAPEAANEEPPKSSTADGKPTNPGAAPDSEETPPKDASNTQSGNLQALDALSESGLIERAHEMAQQLEQFQKQLHLPPEILDLHRELEQGQAELNSELRQARADIKQAARWYVVAEIRFRLAERLRQIRKKRVPLDEFERLIGRTPERVHELRKEWNEVRSALVDTDASPETKKQVLANVVSLRLLALNASRVEHTLARTRALFERIDAEISEVLDETVAGRPTLIEDFSYRESELATNKSALLDPWREVEKTLQKHIESLAIFWRVSQLHLLLHLLILGVLIGATLRARWYYRRMGGSKMLERHLVLQHPVSSAFLLSSIATIFVYPVCPAFVLLGALALAMSTATLLLYRTHGPSALATASLIVPVVSHVALEALPVLDVWMLYLEAAIVFCLAAWMLRYSPFTRGGWGKAVSLACKVWLFCALLGVAAAAASYFRSAAILIDGSARLMLATVAYRVAYDVGSSLIELGFTSPWALMLNSFVNHRPVLIERAKLALRWFLLFLWLKVVLTTYTFYGTAKHLLVDLFETTLSAGTLEVSLGSLFVLLLGIAVAIGAARFVRFVLAEDVMPRTGLRIGTWTAITSSTYYVIIGFGIFTTLAAAGVQLDRLTILVSALGVGIGFGLQNIVQNFISGVILMFERPVNVGDKVQLDQMMGTVQTIGFRASRVRTFDGAEVIVPNSNLISDQVINWSLTDDRRRIEVNVGVAYGTEPEQVLALLLEAAREHPDVIAEPEPDVLFLEFGDSSLNFRLRCYTDAGSRWMNIRSDLTLAVNSRLAAASIEIPYPQRDLHLRSVDESLAGRLFGKPDPKQT